MPFTPFHWGPALLLAMYGKKYLDFPALMIAAVAVDFKTTLVFFEVLEGSLHGFFHTLPGATIIALAVAGSIMALKNFRSRILESIGFKQEYSRSKILAASFLGAYTHVILDAFIYSDVSPFYFITQNPFYEYISALEVYLFCTLTGLIGLLILPGKLEKSLYQINSDLNDYLIKEFYELFQRS